MIISWITLVKYYLCLKKKMANKIHYVTCYMTRFFFCPMKVIDLIFDFQKMAGQNYPWYLQTLDLLNFMIVILVYNGRKVYKYKYCYFPKKNKTLYDYDFFSQRRPSYTSIATIKFKGSQTFPTTSFKAYLYAPISFI